MKTAKELFWTLVRLGALYVLFRLLGDFSWQQSVTLAVVSWAGLGLYQEIKNSQKAKDDFAPFCVAIRINWYALLTDFQLIHTEEEFGQLCEAQRKLPPQDHNVFFNGFTFAVIRPPAGRELLPGLSFSYNRHDFRTDLELSESVIELEYEGPRINEQHPFFHHPRFASLPRLCVKPGMRGYEFGLEVHDDWWEQRDKESDILLHIASDRNYLCGSTRLTFATLPYALFGAYYREVEYDQLKASEELLDMQLQVDGWKRSAERDSEIRDPWSHVDHKYFTVSHRTI